MTYNPDWDIDLAFGEEGEQLVRTILGLAAEQLEVKRKRCIDTKFYVEVAHSPGATGNYKPSGINTTRATYWAYVVGDTGIVFIVPTGLLKDAARGALRVEEYDGDNPTKGRLVSVDEIFAEYLRKRDDL